jgi:hypothetical protein
LAEEEKEVTSLPSLFTGAYLGFFFSKLLKQYAMDKNP